MIRTFYKLASLSISPGSLHYLVGKLSMSMIGIGAMVDLDKKYLREYRCPTCNKLLGKGFLQDKNSYLEIKCRGCGNMYTFTGEDKEILTIRHELLEKGELPDTE